MRELVDILAQCEVPLLSLNKVADELIYILCVCSFEYSIKSLLVLFQLLLRYHTAYLVLAEAPECLLALLFEIVLLFSLGLPVELFKLALLSLFGLHEVLHLLLFFYLLVDKLDLLIELQFLFFSLLNEIRQLIGCLLTILIGVVGYLHNALHLSLLGLEIVRELLVDLLEYLSLPPELVDFLTQLLVVRVSLIVSLV